MVNKGLMPILMAVMLLVLLCVPVHAVTDDEGEILKRIDTLQRQVDEQQKTIDKLSADRGKLFLSKHIDNLSISGDLRVRYELRDRDLAGGGDEIMERMRLRLRAGLLWKSSAENWELGAGLITGPEKGTVPFDTWGENHYFETGDLRLDYAYARHTLGCLKLTAGQQINPFVTSWLLWSVNLRPTGFTAQYAGAGYFATIGAYDLKQYVLANNNTDLGMLYAVQLGTDMKADDVKITLAGSFYGFDGVFERNERPNPDYSYMIGDLYASAGMPLGRAKFSVFAQTFYNFGAEGDEGEGVLGGTLDPEEENLGWVIGFATKMDALSFQYSYAQVGADSCVIGLKDETFGSGMSQTDLKGHRICISYNLTRNFAVAGNVFLYEALERSNQPEVAFYQTDLCYKF